MRLGSLLKTWTLSAALAAAVVAWGANGRAKAAGEAGGADARMIDMARRLAETPPAAASAGSVEPAAADAISSSADSGSVNLEQRPLRTVGPITGAGRPGPAGGRSWVWDSLAAMAVVVLAVFGVRAVLRRWSGGGRMMGAGTGAVEVLARMGVGPRQQVLLLKVGQRVLVVGQTATELSRLGEIERAEEVAEILAVVERCRPGSISQGFGKMLQGFHGEHASEERAVVGGDESESITDRAREGVSGLLARVRNLAGPGTGGRP